MVFVFRFFAIAALLAILRWRCRNSARANRKHCTPITTVQRKNQRLHLTKRVCALIDTTCCARRRAAAGNAGLIDVNCSKCTAVLRESSQIPIPSGFSSSLFFLVERHLTCPQHAQATKLRNKSADSTAIKHVEKIFARTLARGPRTLDSDPNRANHSQVIR